MKEAIFAMFLCLLCCLTVKAKEPGNGHYCLNVGDFAELNVSDGINVVYECSSDSAGIATFECSDDKASMMLFSNDKNTLKIQLQTDGAIVKSLPTITVRSNFLVKVDNYGDSLVVVNNPAAGANIKFRVIGNGNIVAKGLHATCVEGKIDTGRGRISLQGVAQLVKLRSVGTGSIEAGDLKAEKANIMMSGTGSVDCNVTDELYVKGLGTGKVYVKGTSTVKNRTLGSVKVINVENN